ncbi:MAG: glycoside hydrolase family 66 protein [Candidatus Nanopelagicaceae bacterium]|jgi:dextranase
MFEILPNRATYSPADPIEIEIRGAFGFGEMSIWRLGQQVARHPYNGETSIHIGVLPRGCYGFELKIGDNVARTAVEVKENSRERIRYGFVADYSPNRDLSAVSDNIRRLHLSAILFYDWAYRHADLLGGGDNYKDALDQPISLQTVRDLVSTVQDVGASALGYVAIYAVGPNEWSKWEHRALLTASGQPFGLGDFLFLLDPASPDWLNHFSKELVDSVASIGFDGFHLDQFGYPKAAVRADGLDIDVSASFATLISKVRDSLPAQQLVFNNVNDFPTWITAHTPQDGVYIEVWAPTLTLNSLAHMVTRAKSLACEKPVVIAAYQHVYDFASAEVSDRATAFTMATLFSHGATQILAGESDRLLVDPYYVRNHEIETSTATLLKSWYDFVVEHDELLLDPRIVDVTASYAGNYNNDCDVTFENSRVSEEAEPGSIWRRITSTPLGLVIHLINLLGQEDTLWDSPRHAPTDPGLAQLRFRRVGQSIPIVKVADPDHSSRLMEIPVAIDGDYAIATLPRMHIWQIVHIDLIPDRNESGLLDSI